MCLTRTVLRDLREFSFVFYALEHLIRAQKTKEKTNKQTNNNNNKTTTTKTEKKTCN